MSALSRSDREFLRHLAFREAGDNGRPSWVHSAPRNRWQLVVWTMCGSYARAPFVKNGRTLARLEAAGLIAYGRDQYLPAPYQREWGSTVLLTEVARRAIGRDHA